MIRLRAVEISVSTGLRTAIFEMKFGPGLNVLRAPNNSGKSTAMQSVIYAMGLEGMFSARQEAPLPHAITDRITLDGQELPVVQSHVRLEVENGQGIIMTFQRSVVDPVLDRHLIATWSGPLLTQPGASAERRDYFVRRPGAAVREAGFHTFLTDFIGWTLPEVEYFDGSERPLYLEAIFPLFFVEQKQGWGGVRPRVPTYLGIRDVSKRGVEFVLDLSSIERARERGELSRQLAEVASEWSDEHARLSVAAQAEGAQLVGLPLRPTTWSEATRPQIRFLDDEGERSTLDQEIQKLSNELATLPQDPPSVSSQADDLSSELSRATGELRSSLARASALEEALTLAEQETVSIDGQIRSAGEDRTRLLDVRILESLGSPHDGHALAAHDCPTCHQALDDVGLADGEIAMSIDENVRLLEQRLAALNGMRGSAERNLITLQAAVNSATERSIGLRQRIRALKETLLQPGSTPSVASIERRLTLVRQLDDFDRLRTALLVSEDRLERLADRADRIRAAVLALRDEFSSGDLAKLRALTDDVRGQLERYGFGSLPVGEVQVPSETLIPGHEGFDLSFDISASDGIRTKWAYHSALARVGLGSAGHHPGLLMFDEPGQQEMDRTDLSAFIRHSAQLAAEGVQVIVASSEDASFLRQSANDSSSFVAEFDGKLLA